MSQQLTISRKDKSSRNEAIMFRKDCLHLGHVFGKIILAGKRIHSWEMVNLLVRLQFTKQVNAHSSIRPFQIPISEIFFNYDLIIEIPTDLLNNFILGVDQVDC